MVEFSQDFLETFEVRSQLSVLLAQGGQVDLPDHALKEKIESILQTCRTSSFPGGVLPRLLSSNIVYYLVARTSKEWRGLRPLSLAFAGPTVTSFTGQSVRLDASDPVEDLLIGQAFHTVAKIGVPRTVKDFEHKKLIALYAINRMVLLGIAHAGRTISRPETTSEMLQRFEHALIAGDQEAAEEVLEALRQGVYLDALNMKFLRVHLLARLGQWSTLRNVTFFPNLCLTRRPDKVTSAMVEALYRTELSHFENNLNDLVETFRNTVLPISGALFERLPKGASDNVLKAFAVYAMTNPPNSEALPIHLSEAASNPERSAFAELWAMLIKRYGETTAVPDETTFEQLVRIPPAPTIERAFKVLAVAFAEEDLEMAKATVKFVDALESQSKAELFESGKYYTIWRHLREIALSGWMEWLMALSEKNFTQYYEVVSRAVLEWPAREELSDPQDAVRFKDALEQVERDPLGRKRLVDCLPLLLEWIQADDRFPESFLFPAYLALMELYSLSERIIEEALGSFAQLLDGVLDCGLDAAHYAEALDTAIILASEVNGARAIDWLIDFMEITVDHQSPNESKRTELIWTVFETIRRISQPLSSRQLEVLNRLSRVLGIEKNLPFADLSVDEIETSPLAFLSGKHVAIYTLTEDAGRRVADILSKLVPDVKVSLNHDVVGTDALKHLTKRADLFVIVTRSAKHAVTDFIGQHRPKNKPILHPKGKGSSSIFRVLENWGKKFLSNNHV